MKNMERLPDEHVISRRQALGLIGIALSVACGATRPYQEKQSEDFSNHVDFEYLPKNPEFVYLLLFERNYGGNKSDDFIAESEQLAGYRGQHYWHAELVYFDPTKNGWMAIGCRPPMCSADFPVYKLRQQFQGYTAKVSQLRVPLAQQVQARKWFENVLQGQPYNLAGPRSTNCTDAIVGLGQQAGVQDVQNIRRISRDEISHAAGINDFLLRWDLPSVESVMKRESIIFPDELIDVGHYMGVMVF